MTLSIMTPTIIIMTEGHNNMSLSDEALLYEYAIPVLESHGGSGLSAPTLRFSWHFQSCRFPLFSDEY